MINVSFRFFLWYQLEFGIYRQTSELEFYSSNWNLEFQKLEFKSKVNC